MKTTLVISIAVVWGCVIAFWLFALAFNMSAQAFAQAAIVPILACFLGALLLIAVHPASMKWSGFWIAFPTVAMSAYFFFAVLAEGRGADWRHVATAFAVVVAVIVGGACGVGAKRLFRMMRAG